MLTSKEAKMRDNYFAGFLADRNERDTEINLLHARIAQLEEAMRNYSRHIPMCSGDRCTCGLTAALSSPDAGEWLEEQRRLAKIEALEAIPCRLNGIVPPNCNDLDLTGKCLRCAALAELRGGRG
jgi:hypothetical protein